MRIIYLAAAVSLFTACNKTTQKSNNEALTTPEIRGTSHFSKSNIYPYQGMPPMVAAPDKEKDALQVMLADSLLNYLIKDPKAGWQETDQQYAALHAGVTARKQYLGYIILAHKNLVAATGSYAEARKEFYTRELVNTEYKGYCLLYYALKSLPAAQKTFVTEMVAAINRYAANDAAAKVALGMDVSRIADSRMRQKQQDVQLNYSFIEKFTAWQQE